MNFEEKCYIHFNNKYKESVKEVDKKYALGYRDLYKTRADVELLQLQVKILEDKLERVINELSLREKCE